MDTNNVEKRRVASIIVIFCLLGLLSISSAQYYKLGRYNNQLTERIIDTENTNRRLAETVGQCQSICNELEQSIDRNIRTAQEAVELLEEIRTGIQSLEMVTGNWNPDDYYNYWDNVFSL